MNFRLTSGALLVSLLTGCAAPTLTSEQAKGVTTDRTNRAIAEFAQQQPRGVVREIETPNIDFRKTEAPKVRGDVNVRAASTPFAPLMSEIARKAGYSVAFGDMVDLNRKVTVDFNNAFADDAIRTAAFLAGYVAVIDKQRQTVMVSDVGTYTFRLPSGVFSTLSAQYNVGGNPANSGGGGGSGAQGGGGGGGGGGTSLRAEFSVSGREGSNPQGLTKFLQDLAGKNAEVLVTDSGHISVRANAQALKRVNDFLQNFARDAMTQVEIEASVIEVGLSNEFSLGIQWGKVLNAAGNQMVNIGGLTGATLDSLKGVPNAANPSQLVNSALDATANTGGIGAMRVGASSLSIIKALAQFTDVNVVSQPRLVSLNNVPATFFDGTQLPYLGSVQQTAAATQGGAPTVTGNVAFAIDGVSFSAIPSVVDASNVQITLIPVLSTVGGFSTFLNGQLTAPKQSNKQTYMRVLAESGKTLILGGIRYSLENKETSLAESTSKRSTTKEVVILLRTNVVPAPDFQPIISESL